MAKQRAEIEEESKGLIAQISERLKGIIVEKSVSKKSMKTKQATSLQLTSWKDVGMAYFLELSTWQNLVSKQPPLASLSFSSYFFAHPILLLCSSPSDFMALAKDGVLVWYVSRRKHSCLKINF